MLALSLHFLQPLPQRLGKPLPRVFSKLILMALLQMVAFLALVWLFVIVGAFSLQHQAKILPAPFSAEITDALALQDGALLALDLGISHAIVESDGLLIIQAIIEGELGGVLGHIV